MFEDGGIKLIRGDALDVLPDLPPVDAVVTDPPYGINYNPGGGGKGIGGGVTPTPKTSGA